MSHPPAPPGNKKTLVAGAAMPPPTKPAGDTPAGDSVSRPTMQVPGGVRPGAPVEVERAESRPYAPTMMASPEQSAEADFQARRDRMSMAPSDLHEPGADRPRLRLQVGKPVVGTRYRIIRWLGEGGMGVVYEAEHMDIERRVALKILRFDLSQEASMATVFRDEARAASKIGSKHIVDIFDFGELPDGRLYFCMELLDGLDLVPESEDASMDPGRLIGLLRQLCKGLGAAHAVGIVHRDIKPENIIVVRQEGREVVKIVDFGISAMLAAGQSEGGSIAGTPHYMPPEQILGQAFDGRCDQYAVGCMAYELLVGHPPFVSNELEELLDAQVNQDPPPLASVRSDINIPANLAQVIENCLAKDAENRYPNMIELEFALCQAQIADGITTPWDDLSLPEVDEERRAWLLKHMPSPNVIIQQHRRWIWPAVAGISALAAGGALWWATHRPPTEQQRDQIEEIASAALEAGAKTHWVYPALGDPEGQTSYRKVLELEALEGRASRAAEERAVELRGEFATALRSQGDQFWVIPETKTLARDFYWQAWLFDQDDGEALERSGLTPGQIATFRDKAAEGAFTRQEIVQGRASILAAAKDESVLASDEAREIFSELTIVGSGAAHEALRARGIRATAKSGLGAGADATTPEAADDGGEAPRDLLDPFADTDGVDTDGVDTDGVDTDGVDTDGDVPISDEDASLILDEVAEDGGDRGRTKKKRRRRRNPGDADDVDLSGAKSDPEKAKALANEGAKALSSGRRADAERLFNQAISYDRRNAKALMGLSDVYFDTGQSNKAVLYAERAVRAASRTSSYRLKLGDAYYKVLRYKDALEQYEKAKELGSSKADSRIAKVKAKIGG